MPFSVLDMILDSETYTSSGLTYYGTTFRIVDFLDVQHARFDVEAENHSPGTTATLTLIGSWDDFATKFSVVNESLVFPYVGDVRNGTTQWATIDPQLLTGGDCPIRIERDASSSCQFTLRVAELQFR